MSTRRAVTLCLWFHCFRLFFYEVRALSSPKMDGDVDTMFPEQTRLPIVETPALLVKALPDVLIIDSGHCRVWISPRNLLLHVPLTDPHRRLSCGADSRQRDLGRPRWIVLWPSRHKSNHDCPPLASHASSLPVSSCQRKLPSQPEM